jgi:hypothetical protein
LNNIAPEARHFVTAEEADENYHVTVYFLNIIKFSYLMIMEYHNTILQLEDLKKNWIVMGSIK